ncbi:hypothetical protein NEOLI_000532 [Neolecta irregularis DAH-3]|uniref:Uncharacterized protein n=1 Tax=Neolecta irregularis (strain DAH-3) TaxID=1198029 RepID=A0A1U7LT12_NEOID|nr:hypothetical protein NEOLI_000532 [Neolecta irregularis DAH-3]|eukprot:OLL25810.1 hypothetical protein NEOLI_000532 [Neolecta irregularis DAH-3]
MSSELPFFTRKQEDESINHSYLYQPRPTKAAALPLKVPQIQIPVTEPIELKDQLKISSKLTSQSSIYPGGNRMFDVPSRTLPGACPVTLNHQMKSEAKIPIFKAPPFANKQSTSSDELLPSVELASSIKELVGFSPKVVEKRVSILSQTRKSQIHLQNPSDIKSSPPSKAPPSLCVNGEKDSNGVSKLLRKSVNQQSPSIKQPLQQQGPLNINTYQKPAKLEETKIILPKHFIESPRMSPSTIESSAAHFSSTPEATIWSSMNQLRQSRFDLETKLQLKEKELEISQKELENVKSVSQDLKKKFLDLRKFMNGLGADYGTLWTDLRSWSHQVTSLSTDYAAWKAGSQQLYATIEGKTSHLDIEKCKNLIKDLDKQLAQCEMTRQSLKQRCENDAGLLAEERDRVVSLEAELVSERHRSQSLQNTLNNERDATVNELKHRVNAIINEERCFMTKSLAVFFEKFKSSEHSELRTLIEQCNSRATNSWNKLASNFMSVCAKEKQHLQERTTTLEDQINSLNIKIERLESNAFANSETIEAQKQNITELTTLKNQAKSAEIELRNELAAKDNTIQELVGKQNSAQTQQQETQASLAYLESKMVESNCLVDTKKKELEEAQQEISRLNTEMKHLQRSSDQVTLELQSLHDTHIQTQARVKGSEQEIENLKSNSIQLGGISEEYEKLKPECDNLRKELEHHLSQKESLEAQLKKSFEEQQVIYEKQAAKLKQNEAAKYHNEIKVKDQKIIKLEQDLLTLKTLNAEKAIDTLKEEMFLKQYVEGYKSENAELKTRLEDLIKSNSTTAALLAKNIEEDNAQLEEIERLTAIEKTCQRIKEDAGKSQEAADMEILKLKTELSRLKETRASRTSNSKATKIKASESQATLDVNLRRPYPMLQLGEGDDEKGEESNSPTKQEKINAFDFQAFAIGKLVPETPVNEFDSLLSPARHEPSQIAADFRQENESGKGKFSAKKRKPPTGHDSSIKPKKGQATRAKKRKAS